VPPHTPEQPRRSPSLLFHALETIDDHVFHRVKATGLAAEVVVARVLGLRVRSAYCVQVRFDGAGGAVAVSADGTGITAQHRAVHYLALSQGASRALPPNAHPLAAAAVEELTGQANLQAVLNLLTSGHALWRRQADADAAALLDEPLVWAKVCDVSDALVAAGAPGLDTDQIEAIVGEAACLTDHRIWIPDMTGLPDPD
jgi:hypothetical protein